MSTPFRLEQRFAAPLLEVESAFLDPDLLARMAALPDLGRPELLSLDIDGARVTRRVRFAFTGQLSKPALAVVDPGRLTWIEESVLDLETHVSDVVVRPDHYADRLSCRATVVLAEDGDGTVRVTEGRLAVRAPLVSGRVERAIVSGLEANAVAEEAVVREWLAGARRQPD